MKRSAEDEAAGEAASGKPRVKSVECAICKEDESETLQIMDHGCSTCTKGAWMICESCHNHTLSRSCPVCKQHYAPLYLYTIPGVVLPDRAAPRNTRKEIFDTLKLCARLDLKKRTFEAAVVGQNVCVWRPLFEEERAEQAKALAETVAAAAADAGRAAAAADAVAAAAAAEAVVGTPDEMGKMFFCFVGAPSTDGDDAGAHCADGRASEQHLIFEMQMSKSRLSGGRFTFDENVWNEIQAAMERSQEEEEDEEEDGEGGAGAGEGAGEEHGERHGFEAVSPADACGVAVAATGDAGIQVMEQQEQPPLASDTDTAAEAAFLAAEPQDNITGDIMQYVVPADEAVQMMKGQWLSALVRGADVHAMTMLAPEYWERAEGELDANMDRHAEEALTAAEEWGAGGDAVV